VTRANVDHLTFGKGSPHLCMGNALARMEMRLMFEELLPRLASIELAGEVTRVRSNFVNGIKKFPVSVRRKGASQRGTSDERTGPNLTDSVKVR
jgi:cytochrome P450